MVKDMRLYLLCVYVSLAVKRGGCLNMMYKLSSIQSDIGKT